MNAFFGDIFDPIGMLSTDVRNIGFVVRFDFWFDAFVDGSLVESMYSVTTLVCPISIRLPKKRRLNEEYEIHRIQSENLYKTPHTFMKSWNVFTTQPSERERSNWSNQ